MRAKSIACLVLALGLVLPAFAAAAPAPPGRDRMPPRLSFIEGQVSFWRPGAQDWAEAQVNTPLAPGDELATESPGTLEMQVGPRAFVRGWARTQIGLEAQEPQFLQVRLATGDASFDVRGLEPGQILEVDTPNAAFTIDTPGYYRVSVAGERTSFVARRAGRATVTPAVGGAVTVASSEELVIEGMGSLQLTAYVAPPLDDWDNWNYRRTEELLDAMSARYVPPGTYGVDDLDNYGTWRVVPAYGPVWVPQDSPSGWAPYSTGAWVLDPFYGWTWVDTAPWGWAPYHHGRWVFVDGVWAWAPGPLVARPVYAPALVAFFGGPAGGGPTVGWVALGWGEPLVPWWGASGFIHVPSWRGWGGPRMVNNVIISNTTVISATGIRVYHNTTVQNAVVVVHERAFGHGRIMSARVPHVEARNLQLIRTAPRVSPAPDSFVPSAVRGTRPPDETLRRPVVATRAPRHQAGAAGADRQPAARVIIPPPGPKPISVRKEHEAAPALPRPPFGPGTVERPAAVRTQPPPREHDQGPRARSDQPAPPSAPPAATPSAREAPPHAGHATPQPAARGAEVHPSARVLPGEPANRLAPHRGEPRRPERDDHGREEKGNRDDRGKK